MNEIQRRRRELNLTQANIASELGIDASTVAKWETGDAMPRADKLPILARILKCSIDDLFNKEKE